MLRRLKYLASFLVQNRFLIFELIKRDLCVSYAGSLLGIFWTFIHPLVLISIYWLIFSVGLKVTPLNDIPFVIWLVAGISIWFTFADIINGCTSTILNNSFLIKKIVFPHHILPMIKIISACFYHVFFLIILCSLILIYGLPFKFLMIQSLYYYLCMAILALGIGLITSSVNVFIRDTSQVVSILTQLFFWGTPIFWDISIMPQNIQNALKMNPVYYIVQGYRDSFLYFVPFWKYPYLTIQFWVLSLIILAFGIIVFQRLKRHFAEAV
jgi:ABC-type polysaccharide/polyol phosphate export permease